MSKLVLEYCKYCGIYHAPGDHEGPAFQLVLDWHRVEWLEWHR